MGKQDKNRVRFVISHLEGCSGNFLGRLLADVPTHDQDTFYRVDWNRVPQVLAIDGRQDWHDELIRLKQHEIVVTHNYDRALISSTFPAATLIAIYPYTCIGNVLYNICHKKLNLKLPNVIDNHLIHLSEWFEKIQQQRPNYSCVDYWQLRDIAAIEKISGQQLTSNQQQFLHLYWQQQLPSRLDLPDQTLSIPQLIEHWQIHNRFEPWMVSWTIFVFEKINHLDENTREWTVDDAGQFETWQDVAAIQSRYHNRT